MTFRNLRQSWVIRSSVKFVILLVLTRSAQAKGSDYLRAQAIAKSDPLEAEALYERFMQETPHGKWRRAANYDLFYLRLRNGRFVEALAQAASKDLSKFYGTALADAYGITSKQASVLVRRLQAVCSHEEEPALLGSLLRNEKMAAPVWDFALRALLHCKAHGRSQIFASDLFEIEQATRLQTQLRLIAVREQLYADADKALALFKITRTALEEQHPDDEQLRTQMLVLEARIASARADHDQVIHLCKELAQGKTAKPAMIACDLLVVHALLKKGDPEQAWRRISHVQVSPLDLDTRLLRLTVAVAAGLEKPEKLVKFSHRVSYKYCARSLRELAEAVLAEKIPNRR